MKKFIISAVALLGLVFSASAQMIVDAEMFNANPNGFMGKTVTIKNVTLKESNCHTPSPGGVVSGPATSAGAGAPVGVAGPSAGPAKSALCNPMPNYILTKWAITPTRTICIQTDAKTKPMLDRVQTGAVAKSITFRVTPSMYLMTRIEP